MSLLTKTVVIVILLSPMLVGIASAVEIQYIKISPHELDKNFNAHRVSVDIVTDVIGDFVYTEDYYTLDSSGQPRQVGGIRYENNTTTNTLSFNVMRPRGSKGGSEYTLMKAKVIIDSNVIFEEWIPVGTTYKLGSLRTPKAPKLIANGSAKRVILEKPNATDNKSVVVPQHTPRTPGFGIVMATVAILGMCFYRKIKSGK